MLKRQQAERDRLIGARIALARVLKGMTRPALAAALGVGPDQLLRYEQGFSSIAAWRLDDLAAATGRPAAWFVATDHDIMARAAILGDDCPRAMRREFGRAVKLLSRAAVHETTAEAPHAG